MQWMPTMLQVGDTVGLIQPLLYTGVGTVKENDRGITESFALERRAAIVRFSSGIKDNPAQGTVMVFTRDLLFYQRKEIR